MQVGVVDITRVLDESEKGKAMSTKLRATADKWQSQILEVEKKLNQTQERLQKSAEASTPDSVFKHRRDLRIFEIELRSLQERLRFDLEAHREHYRNQLLAELQPQLAEVAREKGVGLILPVGQGDVAYSAPEVDVTDALMARLNK